MSNDYTVDQLAKAIEDTIKAHCPSRLYTYTLPNALGTLPAVAVEPVGSNFEMNMGNTMDVWEFIVYVVVSADHFPTARAQMGKFTSGSGDNSIRRIIFDHRDLGLTGPTDPDVEAFVHGVSGYNGKFPWFNTNHLGAALLVRVYVK